MTNAADPATVKKREKTEKFLRDQEIADVKFLLSTQQGRRYIWKHMSNAGIYNTSFTGNSTTFFNEGKRDIGLKMLAEVMEASPESYVQMMKEANQGEDSNDNGKQ
jgi:hypothetical protein